MPNPVPAAAPGLPAATLTAARWGQLHDMLTLALDALGDGPEDFSPDFLANAAVHQRLTNGAMRRAGVRA